MSLAGKFRHWFTPHHTNNFRAKLLHNSGIFFVIGIVLSINVLVRLADRTPLHILGFTSSVTIDEVVRATNERRIAAGLKALNYNEKLADAARRKAANMLEENYWAHNSPSGKSPWVWFNDAGYKYTFAGENLAKDFGDTSRMMEAWMNSPTHRENIVNAKYQEIGIAVVPGTLQGSETVLVVQLFGTSSSGGGSVAPQAVASPTPVAVASPQVAVVETKPVETPAPLMSPEPAVISATPEEVAIITAAEVLPTVNEFKFKKYLGLAMTILFIVVLVIDLIIAESKSLSRRVGKNWAHIVFINVILLAITIVNAGHIK
jgi:hypothetical protein